MNTILDEIDRMRVYLPPVDEGKLKYFAAFIMLIDHAAYAFLEVARTENHWLLMSVIPHGKLLDTILRGIGRQAFPIFCFFLVEGLKKTRSRLKYFVRLLIFAVLSQFPFQKCFFPQSPHIHGNVICTLTIGFLTIWVIDSMKQVFLDRGPESSPGGTQPAGLFDSRENASPGRFMSLYGKRIFNTGIFLFVSASTVYGFSMLADKLSTDYSYGGVLTIVIMYLLQNYRIPSLFISWAWLSWYNNNELFSAPAFILLAAYNGKRGRQQKYFFYVFYPLHLLILWLVRLYFFKM